MEEIREDLQLLITGDVVERDTGALKQLVIRIDAREPRKFGGVERGCEHRWRRCQPCMKLCGVPAVDGIAQRREQRGRIERVQVGHCRIAPWTGRHRGEQLDQVGGAIAVRLSTRLVRAMVARSCRVSDRLALHDVPSSCARTRGVLDGLTRDQPRCIGTLVWPEFLRERLLTRTTGRPRARTSTSTTSEALAVRLAFDSATHG
jgi:hypothetical protein